jgi:hypothetical protein
MVVLPRLKLRLPHSFTLAYPRTWKRSFQVRGVDKWMLGDSGD